MSNGTPEKPPPANRGRKRKVDGAKLLERVYSALTDYVVFPSEAAAVANTLWIAASHAQPAWEHATRLVFASPEKRCGKSRALDITAELSYKKLMTVNATVAAITRSIGKQDPPTIFVDEADAIFSTRGKVEAAEELRGIFNAGFQRDRPMIRWDVMHRRREEIASFAMVAFAAIKSLPGTIEDRAIIVRMRRRTRDQAVKKFRQRRDSPPLHALREELALWVREHLDQLREAVPNMPESIEDRAQDKWEPLLAIADLAGGDWPERAHDACLLLCADVDNPETQSIGVRLLSDLRRVFGPDEEALSTHEIIERLSDLEEAPWTDYKHRGVSDRDLAELLHEYEVQSGNVWVHMANGDRKRKKGYRRRALADPWERYLPPLQEPGRKRRGTARVRRTVRT